MVLGERVVIRSALDAKAVLDSLLQQRGWRSIDNVAVPPYALGSRKNFVRVRGNRFTMSIYAMRFNSFAPVCTGTVTDLETGGSVLEAHYRLNWFTRPFMLVWFGGFGAAIVTSAADDKWTGFASPRVEFLVRLLVYAILLSPIPIAGALLVYFGSRADHLRERLRALLELATGTATAAPP